MIMIVAGMIGIFIFFVLLFSNSNNSEEKTIIINSTGVEAYIQFSWNKKYQITNNDIPGIIDNGPGEIMILIDKNAGKSSINVKGFNGGISFIHADNTLYVNNIDIWQLVNELKNRRRT